MYMAEAETALALQLAAPSVGRRVVESARHATMHHIGDGDVLAEEERAGAMTALPVMRGTFGIGDHVGDLDRRAEHRPDRAVCGGEARFGARGLGCWHRRTL